MQGTPGSMSQAGKKEWLLRIRYQIRYTVLVYTNYNEYLHWHFWNAAWNSTETKHQQRLRKLVKSYIKVLQQKRVETIPQHSCNIHYIITLFKLLPKIVYSLIFLTSDHWVMVSASLLYMNQDKYFTHPINQGIVLQKRKCSQVQHSKYFHKLYLSNSQNLYNLLSSSPTVI